CCYHYMESGARPHEEIGYTFGNALIILDSIRPKMSPERFTQIVERISFFINSGIELIPEICKVRAYSKLWTDLCRNEYGIENVRFRAGCQVRSLGLTSEQPENNIVRIVLEALPVLLSASARVNALQLPGFREAISLPDQMEQRLSLRTQQILMHETKIANYPDIFEGNPVVAELTKDILAKAKGIALELRSSGYETAISRINTELTRAMIERQERIDIRDDIVVGVNDFLEPVGLSEQLLPPAPTAQNPDFESKRASEVDTWRSHRDPRRWAAARYNLSLALKCKANIMPATLEFVRACCTVLEWNTIIE
ncbi:MAG: methylmalonyl-CoA mutase family protein, partial [Bacteroidota bacterium]